MNRLAKLTSDIVNPFLVSFVVIILLGILFFLFTNKNFRMILLLKKEINELKVQIDEMEKENEKLRNEVHNMKHDSGYFEDLAREKLGLIKPGEIKYKFITPEDLKKEDDSYK